MDIKDCRVDQKIIGPSETVYRVLAVGHNKISAINQYPHNPNMTDQPVLLDQPLLDNFMPFEDYLKRFRNWK